MAEIFISYRSDDTRHFTGRLSARLRDRFGKTRVFLAPDDIPLGQPFDEVLEEQLGRCRVLLAVIGRRWLAEEPQSGSTHPSVYVEREVRVALQRGIPTVPIRVDDAPVPANLPGPLAELSRRQWQRIDSEDFDSGADLLIERLEKNYFPSLIKTWGLVGARVLLVGLGALILVPTPRTWLQALQAVIAFGVAAMLTLSPNRGWPWRRK